MFSLMKLKGSVGSGYLMDPDDVVSTRDALCRLERYHTPKVSYDRNPLIDGLRSFQKENKLYIDGNARRHGPTHKLLNADLWQRERGRKNPLWRLDQSVGRGGANRDKDVRFSKQALAMAGYYPAKKALSPSGDSDPRRDADFEMALSGLQRDFNLHRDGLMRPDGKTANILKRLVQPVISGDMTFPTIDGKDDILGQVITNVRKMCTTMPHHEMDDAPPMEKPTGRKRRSILFPDEGRHDDAPNNKDGRNKNRPNNAPGSSPGRAHPFVADQKSMPRPMNLADHIVEMIALILGKKPTQDDRNKINEIWIKNIQRFPQFNNRDIIWDESGAIGNGRRPSLSGDPLAGVFRPSSKTAAGVQDNAITMATDAILRGLGGLLSGGDTGAGNQGSARSDPRSDPWPQSGGALGGATHRGGLGGGMGGAMTPRISRSTDNRPSSTPDNIDPDQGNAKKITGRIAKKVTDHRDNDRQEETSQSRDTRLYRTGQDPFFDTLQEKVKPREGDRNEDSGGPTVQGVSTTLPPAAREKYPERFGHFPSDVEELSQAQRDTVVYYEIYKRGKFDRLQREGTTALMDKAVPNATDIYYDFAFNSAPESAHIAMQKALNKYVVGKDGTPLEVDGDMGIKTRARLRRAVEQSKLAAVLNEFVDNRLRRIGEDTVMKKESVRAPGWLLRFEKTRPAEYRKESIMAWQEAINDIYPATKDRKRLEVDGNLGDRTTAAMVRILKDGRFEELWEKRMHYLNNP